MAQLGFNPDAVPESDRDFPILPDGQYVAQIIESDVVATKTGSGEMLKLTWEIMEGACRGRKLFDRLNIRNANSQAQDIAQRSLKKICLSAGHAGVLHDSFDLHFKPMRIRVGNRPRQDEYGAQNTIKNYEPLSGPYAPPSGSGPSSQAQPQEQPRQPVAASGGARTPWHK